MKEVTIEAVEGNDNCNGCVFISDEFDHLTCTDLKCGLMVMGFPDCEVENIIYKIKEK